MNQDGDIVPGDSIESLIHTIRGQKVILADDLARLYGVPTKRLNEQVKRNRGRFPDDFMLQLSHEEAEALLRSRSQIATLKRGGNIKYRPFAFTENGAVMSANILNSPQAVRMSVFVVRAFVKMRELLTGTRELAAELRKLEAIQALKRRPNPVKTSGPGLHSRHYSTIHNVHPLIARQRGHAPVYSARCAPRQLICYVPPPLCHLASNAHAPRMTICVRYKRSEGFFRNGVFAENITRAHSPTVVEFPRHTPCEIPTRLPFQHQRRHGCGLTNWHSAERRSIRPIRVEF